jgi:WD40 repeat protein/serine/threonine protein kinase
METIANKELKGYQIEGLIDAGNFGAVYRAKQKVIEREVAIKVLWPVLAGSPDFIRRFETEAQLIAGLEHPHIVPLYDYWRDPDGAYIVMRWLRGGHLRRLMENPLPLEKVMTITEQISSALAFAHQYHIIHLDLKPENVLLDEYDNIYLADFGLSQIMRVDQSDENITELGSMAYAAPEQFTGEAISPQTDQYSLGILLYELITGRHPFPKLIELSPNDAIRYRINAPLPPLRHAGVSREFDPIIGRMTHRNPAERFPDMPSLLSALQGVLNPQAIVIDQSTTLSDIPNPYKGLRTFQESDASNFFGRDSLIKQLIYRFEEPHDYNRFLAVVGASGSGKSSVVKAGLIPLLRQGGLENSDKWFFVEMVPSAHPFEELAATLTSIATKQPDQLAKRLRDNPQALSDVVETILPDDQQSELFLFIDQFEEVFTLVHDEAEASAFLELVFHAIANPKHRIRIIITLRADFYDRPLSRPVISDLISKRTEVVIPLSHDELEQVILWPARRVGVQIEPQLIKAIVDEVSDQPASLPLLQYLMSELFANRTANLLTHQAYQKMGGVRGALARRADEIYQQAPIEQQTVIQQLFLRLIMLGEGTEDTRRRVSLSEINTLFTHQRHIIHDVIERLGKSRLITFDRDPVTHTPTVEVTHEAVIREWRRLRDWLTTSRDDLRLQRMLSRLSSEWKQSGKDASYLLTGSRLEQFKTWMEQTALSLNEDENSFYQACVIAQEKEQAREQERMKHERLLEQRDRQRLRLIAAVLAFGAVTSLILMLFALDQSQRAQVESQLSLSLVQESNARQALRDGDSDLAVVLALSANDTPNPSIQAWRALNEVAFTYGTRHLLSDHTSIVTDVAISPNQQFVASVSRDRSLKIWDMQTGNLQHSLIGHRGDVQTVVFSPDSQIIASGGLDFEVVLWDAINGVELRRLTGHTANVLDVNFSPDGKYLISASRDRSAILWDVETGEIVRRFEGHTTSVQSAEIGQPNQDHVQSLATASGDGEIILWNMTTGEMIHRIKAYTTAITDVDFGQSGDLLASVSADGVVTLWDVGTGELIRQFERFSGGVNALALTPDESMILIGTVSGVGYVFDVATGQDRGVLRGHQGEITSLSLDPQGHYAVTGSNDLTARVWHIRNPTERAYPSTGQGRISGLYYLPDGELMASGVSGGIRSIGEEATGLEGLDVPIRSMAFNASGIQALLGLPNGHVQIWDMSNNMQLADYAIHENVVLALEYHPNQRQALSASQDGKVIVWDVQTGEAQMVYEQGSAIFSAVFSPDGHSILIGTGDGSALWLNAQTGEVIHHLEGHQDVIWSVAISPDGRTALTGSRDANIIWWDVSTQTERARLNGHTDVVWDVDFSDDGEFALSGSGDGTAILWKLSDSQMIQQFHANKPVFKVAFSPDGEQVAVGLEDGTVYQWEKFSLPELIQWVKDHRYIRELTCLERSLYRVEPFCD